MNPNTQPAAPAKEQYIREETGYYVYRITLTANQSLPDQSVIIDGDSDFFILEVHGTQTGNYLVNFRSNNGRSIAQVPIRNANLVGTGQFPIPLTKPLFVPARGRIAVDVEDLSGSGNTIELIFGGIRAYAN